MRIFISVVVATLLGALAFEGPGAALGLLVGLVAGLIWYGPAREAKPEPAGPTLVQRLLSGNLVAKFGVVILFFGVAFLIKFALENAIVPVEVWFALAALGGAVLLAIGWRLRERMSGYALILQGGGVGTLYLELFGAFKLSQLR